MGLVFVPTPLGNLRDITLRALDTLRDAALIVAEDSRVARRLLSAYEIPGKEIWTYHEHNAAGAMEWRYPTPVPIATSLLSPPGRGYVAYVDVSVSLFRY